MAAKWNAKKQLIFEKVIGHFKNQRISSAVHKWRVYIEQQIWTNLELKARNIAKSGPLGMLKKKELDCFLEWIDPVAGDIFARLTKGELRELITGSEYYEYRESEPLFFQGAPGKHYFVVLRGRVKVCVLKSTGVCVGTCILSTSVECKCSRPHQPI